MINDSRLINDFMPHHIYQLLKSALQEKKIDSQRAKIAILGYSYIGNSDDTRNSPTEKLIEILDRAKIKYKIHDPFVSQFNRESAIDIISQSDAIMLMTSHSRYRNLALEKIADIVKNKIIIDGRNFFDSKKVKKLGFLYKGIGNI